VYSFELGSDERGTRELKEKDYVSWERESNGILDIRFQFVPQL